MPTDRAAKSLLVPQDYTPYAADLSRQASLFLRRLRRQSRSSGIPIAQLMLLSKIERLAGAASPSELAALEGVRPQNLSATLAELEKQALIVRQSAAGDKRKVVVSLTQLGVDALAANRVERESWLARSMTQHLNAAEIELLRRAGILLERLAQSDAEEGS